MKNINIYAFADEASPNIDNQIIAMQRNGLSGLEIRGVDGENVSSISLEKAKEVKKKMDDAGLVTWSIGSPIGKIKITDDTKILSKNEKVMFVGDGSVSFREKLIESLNEKAYFAPLHLNNQLSTSIAKAALEKANLGETESCDTLMPMYLKKSQAEREAEKNGN